MVADSDRLDVERQLGRAPRSLAGVAARCPFGRPAVLLQAPYDGTGTPFPTLYWLSCRALVQAVGRLEGDGGIATVAALLADDAEMAADHDRAELRVRSARARLAPRAGPMLDDGAALAAGIAGEASGGGLKCLHAHAAMTLADPPYLLGERVLELAGATYPTVCCSARL